MTIRERWYLGGAVAFLLLVGAVLLIAISGSDDSSAPPGQPTSTAGPGSTEGTPAPGRPSGDVPNLWPVDEVAGQRVAREFAVTFSTYMPNGPGSPPAWLQTLRPYATDKFLRIADRDFQKYWWYLTSGGLGTTNAKVVSVATVWKRSEVALFRVVVDRDAQSFNGHPERNHAERVSWDVLVTGETKDVPKVAGCLKSDPKHETELPEGEPADVP